MNEKELKILSHLRKDARTSLSSISLEVGMPLSTVYDKINRMHRNNLIKKYTLLLDLPKLGYPCHNIQVIKISSLKQRELLLFLQKHANVNSIHNTFGDYNIIVETVHRNVAEHYTFLEELKKIFEISDILEFPLVEEVVKEKFIP